MRQPHNIRLKIAYDGSNYLGWQKTPTGPSIEGTLQKVLEKILQEPIQLQAASRTDAGVHARGQVVNFFSNHEHVDLYKMLASLNGLLPKDIAVLSIDQVEASFHPTLDCIGKEYHYSISLGPVCLPEYQTTSWHFPYAVDISKMNRALDQFIGIHDFAAFCNVKKNETYESTVREVKGIVIETDRPNFLTIKIKGNHFLYKMVRNIVGTLIWVGAGKIEPEDISKILITKDRTLAGVTAPAHGLVLAEVYFKNKI